MQYDLEPLADSDASAGISIHSGFPNPAADNYGRHTALALDLNQLLVRHPSSTYLFRIHGEHWAEQGIYQGDIALVDRALQASPHDLVIIWQDDNFEIRRRQKLKTHQPIWGVISAIIHPRNPKKDVL